MTRVGLLLIFALAMVLIAGMNAQPMSQRRCPRNEIWRSCGSRCPPTCRRPSPVCIAACRAGCFCRSGLIRNNRGVCVRRC
ncbi:chymotrypsin inhibitor [Fopius arisanus]|uniref:Chymotrypsin inhibitor n=1 Tax=Fopius arisanus TaxID=64838 RepID=A0A9R1TWX1_9HYME|nr:PREDICTED: chymotrypsin inhibitor-like [Fopius arisanus]